MGFKRTTLQLASIISGTTMPEMTVPRMKAMIDWLGSNPFDYTRIPVLEGRIEEARQAFGIEPDEIAYAKVEASFWEQMHTGCSSLGLSKHQADRDGAYIRALLPDVVIEPAADDEVIVVDIDSPIASLKKVVIGAGGSFMDLVVSDSGERVVRARFRIPGKPDAVFSGSILWDQLIFGLDNYEEVGTRYDVRGAPDFFSEDDMGYLADQLFDRFVSTTPPSDEYLQQAAAMDALIKRVRTEGLSAVFPC